MSPKRKPRWRSPPLQLAESRTITSREVDQRKANLEVAKAQQLAAEAALRNAELNLEWTQVRAPIPGRVSDRRSR
jgi:multidrug efflux system membrane fusion protein